MSGIDEELKQMLEGCPILLDEGFQEQHPGIIDVAGFLNEAAISEYRMFEKYPPFDRVGVNNIKDYIALIDNGNPDAVKTYETVRDTLGLG